MVRQGERVRSAPWDDGEVQLARVAGLSRGSLGCRIGPVDMNCCQRGTNTSLIMRLRETVEKEGAWLEVDNPVSYERRLLQVRLAVFHETSHSPCQSSSPQAQQDKPTSNEGASPYPTECTTAQGGAHHNFRKGLKRVCLEFQKP